MVLLLFVYTDTSTACNRYVEKCCWGIHIRSCCLQGQCHEIVYRGFSPNTQLCSFQTNQNLFVKDFFYWVLSYLEQLHYLRTGSGSVGDVLSGARSSGFRLLLPHATWPLLEMFSTSWAKRVHVLQDYAITIRKDCANSDCKLWRPLIVFKGHSRI